MFREASKLAPPPQPSTSSWSIVDGNTQRPHLVRIVATATSIEICFDVSSYLFSLRPEHGYDDVLLPTMQKQYSAYFVSMFTPQIVNIYLRQVELYVSGKFNCLNLFGVAAQSLTKDLIRWSFFKFSSRNLTDGFVPKLFSNPSLAADKRFL
ncbi:hypothetical protein BT96DRAFT_1022750 [Gymnopus androsaceus JB14]|uniref:Uncharacterized protein n=1 Tax=Gymnopus androsaceus JB14 TaxID=1447944 RepID=A0A6A4H9K2_9AGAR|nr:hypothetical protein BT96DRAFT_1022750 [Gymnopus androsaceus JB14]